MTTVFDPVTIVEELEACVHQNPVRLDVLIERLVADNAILHLLQQIQEVSRDTIEFGLLADNEPDAVRRADASLIALVILFGAAEARLAEAGWRPIRPGSIRGSVVYEDRNTHDQTEEPVIDGDGGIRHQALIQQLPMLWTPTTIDDKIVWAVTVVHISDAFAVIDVVKTDDGDGQISILREFVEGPWTGLHHRCLCEIDMAVAPGSALQTWIETTMTGIALLADPSSILLIGAGTFLGIAPFLATHHSFGDKVRRSLIIESDADVADVARRLFYVDDEIQLGSAVDLDPEHTSFELALIDATTTSMTLELVDRLVALVQIVIVALPSVPDDVVALLRSRVQCLELLGEFSLRPDVGASRMVAIAVVDADRVPIDISVCHWQASFEAAESGAMDLSQAQQTAAVCLPAFVSPDEIAALRSFAESGRFVKEVRSDPADLNNPSWYVLYLQTKGQFHKQMATLRRKLLEAVIDVDRQQGWKLMSNREPERIHVRVAEFHSYSAGGKLDDPMHYDAGSLITIDVMLSGRDDFDGGLLCTDGRPNRFERGDAIVFVSHKMHHVSTVTRGTRNVLVVEFWLGPERQCGHRCDSFAACSLDPATNDVSKPVMMRSPRIPFSLASSSIDRSASSSPVRLLLWEPSKGDVPAPAPASSSSLPSDPSLQAAWDLFS